MIRLVPMTETEFEAFVEISMRDHAEDARETMEWQRCELLPEGLATPNHFFFVIEHEETDTKVGGLWFMAQDQGERRRAFVFYIHVYEEFRRRGYGTQAFGLLEKEARQMGLSAVSLHVFGHNHPAMAMYEKLGFGLDDAVMSKEIRGGDE